MAAEVQVSRIKAGAAAAVVYPSDLPEGTPEPEPGEDGRPPKFVVHPHVEEVDPQDNVLPRYLTAIYAGKPAEETAYPESTTFAHLEEPDLVTEATLDLAQDLATAMARKNANRGIVFGCCFELNDGSAAHGLVKVDLSPEQRFYFDAGASGTWSLEQVKDILPPPRQDVAKYLIAPQPKGVGVAGIRDETSGDDMASAYLLEAVELQAPRRRGTRARVAREAHKAGIDFDEVHRRLERVSSDRPTTDVLAEHFPEIPEVAVQRIAAPETPRPMPEVKGAQDSYKRVYKSVGYMSLDVGPEVEVRVQGREVVVTLPEGAPTVTEDFR